MPPNRPIAIDSGDTKAGWMARSPCKRPASPGSRESKQLCATLPPLGAWVLLAMSFAQSLGTRFGVAATNYADNIVRKFRAECEAAADNVKTFVSFEEQLPGGWNNSDVKFVKALVEGQIAKMGFNEWSVKFVKQPRIDYFLFTASWSRAAPQNESAADPAGSTSTCPVFHEDRPVVALMPCGHVVCRQCQGQLRQCPMCRIQLTGATRALFLS